MNLLFESTAAIYGTWTDVIAAPAIENALGEHREKLFEIYSQSLMGSNRDETSFRLVAMRGLGRLCKIRKFLEESEIGMVVQYLDEVALEKEEKDDVRDEALQNLREISKFKSNLIMQITFPAFMAQLPDSEEESKTDNKPYAGTLEALAKLSFERPVFEVLLTRLLNKLEVVLYSKFCSQYSYSTLTISGGSGPEYPRAILSTILYVLQKKPQSTLEDTKAYYTRLVPPLLTNTIIPLVSGGDASAVLADDSVLDVTARLVRIITHDLDMEHQSMIVVNIFQLFVNYNSPSNVITEKADIVSDKFRPLNRDTSKQAAGCTVIFSSVLAAARREILLPVESLSTFLQNIVGLAESPKSPVHRLALLRTIGLVINKWIKDPVDSEQVKQITLNLLASITSSDDTTMDDTLGERLRIVFWIAKALLLRADKFGMEVTLSLVEILGHPVYGATTSRGFAVLLGDDEFLNKDNFAVVRMLYKQRTFAQCVPRIVEGFKAAESATKPNYLIALSNILRAVPSSIITPEMPRLLPLLLQSVDLPDVDVKAATIETLHITISESSDALKEHVSSVITRLLSACSVVGGNSPRIRISALRCLKAFPGALRNELLLPYKRQVMKMLSPVLDDSKRTVRKEAVDCRVKWWAMDEPGDD